VLGNSVVDHVSKCDQDRRSLPELIAEATGMKTLDLSYPGQALEESLNLGALALKVKSVSQLILFASITGFTDHDTLDLQSVLFFRAVGNSFAANEVVPRLQRGVLIFPAVQPRHRPFGYDGTGYPDYNGVAAQYFEREQHAMACPETRGNDDRFIEAYFWNNIVRPVPWLPNVSDVARLQVMARRSDKPLTIVLLPTDFPDLAAVNPRLAADAMGRRSELVAALKREDLDILDASDIIDAEGFSDRFCACGHLTERGRRALFAALRSRL
jgi:hypothetical protein